MPVRMYLFGEPAPHKILRTYVGNLKIHRLGQSTRPWVRLSLGRWAAPPREGRRDEARLAGRKYAGTDYPMLHQPKSFSRSGRSGPVYGNFD